MRHATALWALAIVSYLFVAAAEPHNEDLNAGPDPGPGPGPPYFRMITRGTPGGYGCYLAIAQCPAGRALTLRPAGSYGIQPDPPIQQSPYSFIPQEFRARRAMLRVWPSVQGNLLNYLPGTPGPSNSAATLLTAHEWEQVQDMAVMLLLWMERTRSRRGRVAMPLDRLWLTVELWNGPEVEQMAFDAFTPWACSDGRCQDA
ncbi:hypothetical protein MMC34_006505 [Xylographa carneopallida]|nr:hypothetical protein [Xylographa carneopallida]